MRMLRFPLLCMLAAASLAAHAFERPFPSTAKRGTLSMANYPAISINGKERHLSPGAWIRNERNTIDMPVTLAGREFTVNYTENNEGDIDRIWILTPEEAQAKAPNERAEDLRANQLR